jgi:hypothetical protein
MLNFAAKHFRLVIEISLWINLIFCVILGGSLGKTIFGSSHTSGWGHRVQDESSLGLAFLGIILGFVFGLLTNVIYGGLVAVFLEIAENINFNIAEDLRWLRDRIERMESSNTTSKGSSSTTSKDPIDPLGLTSSNKKSSGDPLGLV